jgi:hypothetical protein
MCSLAWWRTQMREWTHWFLEFLCGHTGIWTALWWTSSATQGHWIIADNMKLLIVFILHYRCEDDEEGWFQAHKRHNWTKDKRLTNKTYLSKSTLTSKKENLSITTIIVHVGRNSPAFTVVLKLSLSKGLKLVIKVPMACYFMDALI